MNKETKKFKEVIKKRKSHVKRVRARKMRLSRPRWTRVPRDVAAKMGLLRLSWYQRVWLWLTKWFNH